MDGAGPWAHWRPEGSSRKNRIRLTQTLQNTQQAALPLIPAWPKLGVSDTSFEPFQIFLIHFSLTPATSAVRSDRFLALGPCYTWGCAVDALPGDYACANW